ncbi:MAG: peptide chain release factor 1 [Dehalococcoidia bacterium]|nr:peptide chain release factor 1 [Dehalococcoidia bacterium]
MSQQFEGWQMRLEALETRYEELNSLMVDPEVLADMSRLQNLAREQSEISELVVKYREYKKTLKDLEYARALFEESADKELQALAKEELESLQEMSEGKALELKGILQPADPKDNKDVIVEIRAGTGGEEAALFAADLFRMYTRYAESKRWHVEVLSSSLSGVGGFKEIIMEVRGKGAYRRLKFESGVHRVQRVPETEASGRIHTSTATVAVLPEADEVEMHIDSSELRIDVFHSGGAGGQNVNKVATAIRITHLPTGIVALCQDERSQLRNRNKAMAVLRARLLAREQEKREHEVGDTRRSQIGSAERAEKIRTYNYPQDRVTDHRINLTLRSLPFILNGELDPIIDALSANYQANELEGQWV